MTPGRWARFKSRFYREHELHPTYSPDLQSPAAGVLQQVLAPADVQQLGRYRIDNKLGEGGMGVVYSAYDTELHRRVALKVLHPELGGEPGSRKRLLSEARTASSLSHPNIVTIHDVGSDSGRDFIAMELLEGRPLSEVIPDRGLPVDTAIQYALQISSALCAAHDRGIVHRDLKPGNIMISPTGQVKLLDFGLARRMSAGDDSSSSTAGECLGTPSYMAPEQVKDAEVGTAADIFAFGAVLYEMLSGRRAFDGRNPAAVLAAVLTSDPPSLQRSVPRDLSRIVMQCLRKDPARRVHSIAEIRLQLERVRPGQQPTRILWSIFAVAAVAAFLSLLSWLLPSFLRPLRPARVTPLTTYPGIESDPALAPDGTLVAFAWTESGREGRSQIYVRGLRSPSAPLRLTTSAADDIAPAWSPDRQQVAFVRLTGGAAAIYLVPALGGEPRRLSELHPPPTGKTTLSWSPNGKWIAAPESTMDGWRGISLISVSTAERRRITANPLDFDSSPSFSPNSRTLAYASCIDTYSCDVYLQSLGPNDQPYGSPRRITHQEMHLGSIAWTAQGRTLLYAASADAGIRPYLWRVPVSGGTPERLELAGPGASDVTAANGLVAYSLGSSDPDLWRYQEGGRPEPFLISSLNDFNPAYSPDGTRLAFASNRSGVMEVWVANADGSNLLQLTTGPGRHQGGPQWSPEGRAIAFSSFGDDGTWAVYQIDAAGGAPRRITPAGWNANTVSWSRDGKSIYFASNRLQGRLDVWRMPVAGGEPTRITTNGGFVAYESWDSRTLYYTKARLSTGSETPVFALDLTSGSERLAVPGVVTHAFAVSRHGLTYFAADRDSGEISLQRLDTNSGRTRRLTGLDATPLWRVAVSPDENTIVFSARKPYNRDLVLIENLQ